MSPEFQKLNALGVYLHDRRVGIISRLGGDQHIFAFEQDYIDDPNRPTLSLSYKSRTGGLVTAVRPVFRRLPQLFSNLLPEGQLRDHLAGKAGVKKEREFYLMAVLGEDLPGAVVVKPLDSSHEGHHDDQHHHDQRRDEEDQRQQNVLRFSLAGVQLKFSAIPEASGGLTIPALGVGGSWIIKLPSTQYAAVPENEFAMLELARAVGIQVPPVRLVSVADIEGLPAETARLPGNALAIERFDRGAGGRRVHMEDFAQVFGLFPDDKYGKTQLRQRRRCIVGRDRRVGHLGIRASSCVFGAHRQRRYAPQELVSAVPGWPNACSVAGVRLRLHSSIHYRRCPALSFGGAKSLHGVTFDQVRRFADTARLPMKPVLDIVRETVERTNEAWEKSGHKGLIPAAIRELIDGQIRKAVAGTLRVSSTNRKRSCSAAARPKRSGYDRFIVSGGAVKPEC